MDRFQECCPLSCWSVTSFFHEMTKVRVRSGFVGSGEGLRKTSFFSKPHLPQYPTIALPVKYILLRSPSRPPTLNYRSAGGEKRQPQTPTRTPCPNPCVPPHPWLSPAGPLRPSRSIRLTTCTSRRWSTRWRRTRSCRSAAAGGTPLSWRSGGLALSLQV